MVQRYNQNKRRVEETKRKRREEKRLKKHHKPSDGIAAPEQVLPLDPALEQPPAEGAAS
jgi:hypothetical protein